MKRQYDQASAHDEVLEKITNGEVTMRSKLYFSAALTVGIVAAVAATVLMTYFVKVVALVARIGTASTPAYGARENLAQTIETFPWWALLLAATSGAVAVWLLREYGRLYRHSLGTVIMVFLVATIIIGIATSFIGGPQGTKNQNNNHQTPVQRGTTLRIHEN